MLSWTFRYEIGILVIRKTQQTNSLYIKNQEQVFIKNILLSDPDTRLETFLALSTSTTIMWTQKVCKIYRENSGDAILFHISPQCNPGAYWHYRSLIHYEDRDADIIKYLLKRLYHFIKGYTEISKPKSCMVDLVWHLYFATRSKNKQLCCNKLH